MDPNASAPPKEVFLLPSLASFVDIRDDDIPGPGTHDASRIDKNRPSKWKFGKSTERDAFLEKYPRPNPSPSQYNPKVDLTNVIIAPNDRILILTIPYPNPRSRIQLSTKLMMVLSGTINPDKIIPNIQLPNIVSATLNKWTTGQKFQHPTPTKQIVQA